MPDYVFEGRNGVLFTPGDAGACVMALRAALRHPLFSRGQVEPATLEQTRAYLSARLMGERIAQTYQLVHERAR
jgi:hypothetical protein